MKTGFKHKAIFPLIFRAITDSTCKDSEYLTHAVLVSELLQNTEGRSLVEAIAKNNVRDVAWTAANLIAWFSQRYTVGKNSYADLLERKKIDGAWAYRSLMATKTSARDTEASLPDVELIVNEGTPELITHLKRERNSKIVQAKLHDSMSKHGKLACECCGFEADKVYPGIVSHLIEVHHRTPLSSIEGSTITTLDDLAILCPTCHRAIHRLTDMSVEDMRRKYFS